MSMPIVSDLDAAMMQPAVSVPAVRRLGGGSIRLNDAQRPLRAAGRDAVVYELSTPSGRILALRVLLRPDSRRDAELAQRYAALRDDPHLMSLRGAGGPLPGDILWVADGIALPGAELQRVAVPLVAMERVPGRTMVRAVDRLCHEGQTEPLALLADSWLQTAIALESAAFSHGDLAADNLIVRPDGTIAVIDLDTAHWPTVDLPADAFEGSPSYMHPRGAPRELARRDAFPALILWASLRILARHPTLRERWGDHPDRFGAALLWSQDDLRRSTRSPLFAAIDALHDDALHPLLEVVRRAIRFSADETPPLSEIANRLDELGFPRLASSPRQTGRRSTSAHGRDHVPHGTSPVIISPFADRPKMPEGGSGDAPAIADEARSRRQPIVTKTTTLVERDRRHAAAQRLAAAVASRDVTTVTTLWAESHAIPEAAVHAAAVHQLFSQEVTTAIDRAMRRNDDQGIIAAVAAAERAGVAPSPEARKALRVARERVTARAALHGAIERRDYPTIANLKLCGQLDRLERLDPSKERAVARALAWPALERALASNDDVAIAAAADPALWREEEALPADTWQRLDLAWRRIRWVEDVRAALRQRDGVVLRGLLAGAPSGAERRLTEVEGRRILRVTMRESAVARLERALRQGPDREVVSALAEFEAAGAPFSEVLDWTAVRGVVDRISLADALRTAAAADPPDTAMLARLLPAARAALGDSDAGGPDWAALEQSVLRAAHLARLREALATNDYGRIASAADPDPFGAVALLSPSEQERVSEAQRKIRNSR
jgi:hypothetical protein